MTVEAPLQAIFVDDDGYYRITDADLAGEAFTNPHVTSANALVPTTPLIIGTEEEPGPAEIYADVLKSEAGRQAQRSLLAVSGERHAQLGDPIEAALRRRAADPDFAELVEHYAQRFARTLAQQRQPLDLAEHAHYVPAHLATHELFWFLDTPEDVRTWARLQGDLIWRRREPGETDISVRRWQMAGLGAARRLQAACYDTVQYAKGHPGNTITHELLASRMSDTDVLGLVYGVGIAAIEGVGYSILNVIYQVLAHGRWRDLAAAPTWRHAYSIIAPYFRADPGIHSVLRTTDAPVTIGDMKIPTGATIAVDLVALGDPFGGDVDNEHWCTGAPPGRIELATVPWVLARYSEDATLVPNQTMRRVNSRFYAGYQHVRVNLRGA